LASLILVVNVVGELQQKRTLAASRGFLAAARLSCFYMTCYASVSLQCIFSVHPVELQAMFKQCKIHTSNFK